MRKGLFTLLSLVCAGLIWAAPAPANAADKIVIRFAHSNTPSDMDPYHALVTKMSDKLVKKLGADRIEIQEFPAGQIGSEERSFQDVQQGILQMTVLAVNNASIFSPSLGAFDLPYIFKSVKEFDDCVDQNWDLINKRMEAESGTVAIAWHSQGFRFITNSKQPISTLAELAPVKIRTPNNPIMIGVYRAWGTDPVPMAMDETFNALQQKVVDGQDNPLVSIATNRFYELAAFPARRRAAGHHRGRARNHRRNARPARQAGKRLPRVPEGKGHGLLRRAHGRGRVDEAGRQHLAPVLPPDQEP